jgi:hypothetical protein
MNLLDKNFRPCSGIWQSKKSTFKWQSSLALSLHNFHY